jgi:hypothetical protein
MVPTVAHLLAHGSWRIDAGKPAHLFHPSFTSGAQVTESLSLYFTFHPVVYTTLLASV